MDYCMPQAQAEEEVRSWGFKKVLIWFDPANTFYSPHKHPVLTTHLILRGELIVTFPDDHEPSQETFGPGSRLDIEAERMHQVRVGEQGATMIIGEDFGADKRVS